jgi:hypothetical protein
MTSIFKSDSPTMKKEVAGFGAILNNCINVCSYHFDKFGNYKIRIDVDEINEIFNTPDITSEGYFDIETDFNNFVLSGLYDNSSNAHVICDYKKVLRKNLVFEKLFSLKHFHDYESNRLISSKTLGVHLRGTDKHNEVPPAEPNQIIKHIKRMFNIHDIDNIFISTDDIFFRDFLISEFGEMIRFNNHTIGSKNKPVHFIKNRSIINKEMIKDVYFLSQCPYFLYCFSNVSYLALTMGIKKFKTIKCLNEDL